MLLQELKLLLDIIAEVSVQHEVKIRPSCHVKGLAVESADECSETLFEVVVDKEQACSVQVPAHTSVMGLGVSLEKSDFDGLVRQTKMHPSC